MKKYLFIVVSIYTTGCAGNKYLQQCQVDGVETLGKGISSLNAKLPNAYSRVNKYLNEGTKMANIYTSVKKKGHCFC